MLHKDDELANSGENANSDKPKPQKGYQEDTPDNNTNGKPNIPGPGEVPDQQKVGEDDEDKYHVET